MGTISNIALHPRVIDSEGRTLRAQTRRGAIVIMMLLGLIVSPISVLARVTPEDIVNAQQATYQKKVVNYSVDHKQKLEQLSASIARVNKNRTNELERNMETQAAILDQYEKRQNDKNDEVIKNARYWITYAHEAVAYQAAKIYIFDLSNEKNIQGDALSTISIFQSELNSARSKVIKSQNILLEVVTK